MRLFDRVNVYKIIVNHFDTLYDYALLRTTGVRKMPLNDRLIFIVFPIVLSLCMIGANLFISVEYLNIILTCLSILTGLLFGLLTTVFELAKNLKIQLQEFTLTPNIDYYESIVEKKNAKYTISKELFINISFSIIVSIAAIISSLLSRFRPIFLIDLLRQIDCFNIIRFIILAIPNFVAYFLIGNFILTILMILKRFYLLFESETRDLQ